MRVDRAYEAWLQALHLTPDSLDLSANELHGLRVYLESILFLIRCKQSAKKVSPAVWEKIESALLRSTTRLSSQGDTGDSHLLGNRGTSMSKPLSRRLRDFFTGFPNGEFTW